MYLINTISHLSLSDNCIDTSGCHCVKRTCNYLVKAVNTEKTSKHGRPQIYCTFITKNCNRSKINCGHRRIDQIENFYFRLTDSFQKLIKWYYCCRKLKYEENLFS